MASCPFRGNERHVTGKSLNVSGATVAVGGDSPPSSAIGLSSLDMLVVPWRVAWFEQTRRRIVFIVVGINLIDVRSRVAIVTSKRIYMLRGCCMCCWAD